MRARLSFFCFHMKRTKKQSASLQITYVCPCLQHLLASRTWISFTGPWICHFVFVFFYAASLSFISLRLPFHLSFLLQDTPRPSFSTLASVSSQPPSLPHSPSSSSSSSSYNPGRTSLKASPTPWLHRLLYKRIKKKNDGDWGKVKERRFEFFEAERCPFALKRCRANVLFKGRETK